MKGVLIVKTPVLRRLMVWWEFRGETPTSKPVVRQIDRSLIC